jgi:hypothetical protein
MGRARSPIPPVVWLYLMKSQRTRCVSFLGGDFSLNRQEGY